MLKRLKRKLDDLDSWSICHRLCLRQFLVGPALTVVDVSVVVETVVTITVTEVDVFIVVTVETVVTVT